MHRIGNRYVQVSILHIAKQYQMHYKAIDYFDQLTEIYTVGRRYYRSWMYIFSWLINTTIVNSYILHGMSSTVARKKKYAQIDFRHKLALGLINNYNGRQIRPQPKPQYIGPGAPEATVNHVNTHMNVSRVCTCKGHKKYEGKNKRTIYGCTACNAFLCKSCHPKWHTQGT